MGDGTYIERRRPVAIDLFAGAGGMSLGFEQAGFDVVCAVEYDPVHAATHEFNFPLTKVLCADVARLDALELLAAARLGAEAHGHDPDAWDGTVDAIFGGPPCQGFSFIGRRLIDDRRNALVFHFFRLVSEVRPRYVVMENVPGMARGGHASILAQLVREFEEAGYRFPPEGHRVLDAARFGVPQERKRLFLVGAREGEAVAPYPAAAVRPAPKRSGNAQPELRDDPSLDGLPAGPTVRDAIGDLPDLNRYRPLRASDEVRLTPRRLAAMERAASPYARQLMGLDVDPLDRSRPRAWDRAVLTSSARTEHTSRSIDRFRRTRHGDTEPVSRFYKLDPHGLSNTLRAGTGSEGGAFTSPRPIHPSRPRVISVREAARLHSFPDWFRFHETKWNGFRQIGNAVAPPVARAVGASIVAGLGLDPPVPKEPITLGDRALLAMTMHQAAQHFGADRDAIPAGRRRDWTQVAAALFERVHRPGAELVEFGDEDVLRAFRDRKIRPPERLSRFAELLARAGGLPDDVQQLAPGGRGWRVEAIEDGRYRFVPAARCVDAGDEPTPERLAA